MGMQNKGKPSEGYKAPAGGFDAPAGGFDAPAGGLDALAGALSRAAEALHATAARLSRVEATVGELIVQGVVKSHEQLVGLQELDLSAQEVGALAAFLSRLAENTPCALTVDVAEAARSVMLNDLSDFLTHRPIVARAASDGDVDLFI